MAKKIAILAILMLIATSATAAPTCWMCQNWGCDSSLSYLFQYCIGDSNYCHAWDLCEFAVPPSDCKDRLLLQLARSETFGRNNQSTRIAWRLTGSSVQPALQVAGAK